MVAFEGGYSFWDTVTAAYLGNSDLFTFATQTLAIVTDESSPDLGNITVTSSGGYPIDVAQRVDVNCFYQYSRNSSPLSASRPTNRSRTPPDSRF
jgi:inosine-uridine nucleoside N-ribohydrolase